MFWTAQPSWCWLPPLPTTSSRTCVAAPSAGPPVKPPPVNAMACIVHPLHTSASSSRSACIMTRANGARRAVRTILRRRGVAGWTAVAAGAVVGGLVAWPIMDGFGMPQMVRIGAWWNANKMLKGKADAIPGLAALLSENERAVMLVVDGREVGDAAVAASADGRSICLLNLECVTDSRVFTWALLNELLRPTGCMGSRLLGSYVRAVYIVGSLATGNQGTEHMDFMFFLAFLDYMCNALRAADHRPVIVIRGVEDVEARAAEAAKTGDADRAKLLRRNLHTLMGVAERMSVVEGVADCVMCVDPKLPALTYHRDAHKDSGTAAVFSEAMRRFDDVIVQWARDVTVDKADMIPLLRYSEAGMLDLEDLELYRSMEPTKKHVRSLLYKLDSSCGPKNLRDVPVTQLPVVGVTPANLEECVESGKVGARLLELTAATQAVAGDVVAELGIRKVRRNELFFFTKVQKDVTEEQLTALHEQLNIQSIDMVLLDCEGISSEEARAAWSVLEAVKSANMVRCIGVSQCPLGLYDELVYEGASHHPAVNEISYTLRNPNYDYVKGCANRGMAIIARVSDADLEFDEPKLDELAESVQLTPQQVALSYIAQQGIVPILAVPAEDGDERKLATLLEGVKTIVEFQEEHLDMFEGFAEGAAAPEEAEGEAAAAPNGEAAAEEQADEAAEE